MVRSSITSAEVIEFPGPDNTTSPEWDAAVLSWEISLNQRSPATRKVYLGTLRLLAAFLVGNRLPTRPAEIDPTAIREFLGSIPTPSTARLRFQTLRTFFSFLVREEEIDRSPTDKVDQPDVPEDNARKFLSDEDFTTILATCRKGRDASFIERRDRALLLLLRHSGLRRSEAAALTIEDVDPRTGELVVRRGKGGDSRPGGFDRETAAAILRYQPLRDALVPRSETALWINDRRAPMTGDAVGAMVMRRAKLAGVASVSAHELRHLWAHDLKRRGISDETLRTFGEWSKDSKVPTRYGRALARERAAAEYRRLMDGETGG